MKHQKNKNARLTLAFRSGMSRTKDLNAAMDNGVSVGVVAGELNLGAKLLSLPNYLVKGGAVFIDSAAFAERRTGVAPDFDDVMDVYETVADLADFRGVTPDKLYVVAPDKVGDQVETLRRLTRYRDRIVNLIALGVKVIVPVQRGVMRGKDMLEAVAGLLGTRNFVAGIPSNLDALPLEEIAELRHPQFHILGRVQADADQLARLTALGLQNGDAVLTADANWLRGKISAISLNREQAMVRRRSESTAGRFMHPLRTIAVTEALQADTTWGRL